jgi:hypothetical protein
LFDKKVLQPGNGSFNFDRIRQMTEAKHVAGTCMTYDLVSYVIEASYLTQ